MSILTSWVTRLALFLLVVGVLAFNGVEVLVAHVSGKDDANNAAYAAAQTWTQTHNAAQTLAAARAAIPSQDRLATNGCSATDSSALTWVCTIHRPVAHTVLMDRIGSLRKYTVVTETGSGTDST